jgi:hypothetical protein
MSGNLPIVDTFCNFVSNNVAVSRNFEPGLAVMPFSLDPEVLYGDTEVCSFYSSDFPLKCVHQ